MKGNDMSDRLEWRCLMTCHVHDLLLAVRKYKYDREVGIVFDPSDVERAKLYIEKIMRNVGYYVEWADGGKPIPNVLPIHSFFKQET